TALAPHVTPNAKINIRQHHDEFLQYFFLASGVGGNRAYIVTVLVHISCIQLPWMMHLWIVAMRKEDRLAEFNAAAHIRVPESLRVKNAIIFGKRLREQVAIGEGRSIRIIIVQRHTTRSKGTQRLGFHLCSFKYEQKVGLKGGSSLEN